MSITIATAICGTRRGVGFAFLASIRAFVPNATVHVITDDESRIWEGRGVVQHRISASDAMLHKGGRCNSARFAIADLLPHSERVLYMDVDVVTTIDARPLFDLRFQGNEWAGFVQESESGTSWYTQKWREREFVRPRGINCGVWLMDPRRMSGLLEYARTSMNEFGDSLWDQHVMNAYFHRHPDELTLLPCRWNMRHNSRCDDARGIFHGTNRIFEHPRRGWWSGAVALRRRLSLALAGATGELGCFRDTFMRTSVDAIARLCSKRGRTIQRNAYDS